ncbi:hypothetical protein AVEN_169826-1 [Araneus ventricosus]|uniref:Uncharacterized protein n=1 Tax=Araneus ventricosus TaxID=182803 RepID=A0A4Y2H1M1_ARAVE|nr:hypothetical protein AVEN_140290-1 [Araneus ventricosus]GBM60162.1 hypothetical protein AVEN_169826-1 [Araneus ventricosus]
MGDVDPNGFNVLGECFGEFESLNHDSATRSPLTYKRKESIFHHVLHQWEMFDPEHSRRTVWVDSSLGTMAQLPGLRGPIKEKKVYFIMFYTNGRCLNPMILAFKATVWVDSSVKT